MAMHLALARRDDGRIDKSDLASRAAPPEVSVMSAASQRLD